MSRIATLTLNPALDTTTRTDLVQPTHKLRCSIPRLDAGGGGINVARVVTALGGDTLAIFPSGGATGSQIETLLADAGVPSQPIPIGAPNRESFTVDEGASGTQYRFVLPGPTLTLDEQTACLKAIADLSPQVGWLVLSGSLPPGMAPDFCAAVSQKCRAHGIALVLDTSGHAVAAAPGLGAALIKPSLHELEELVGRPLPDREAQFAALHQLWEGGLATAILLSLGEDGAILVTADIQRHFPAIKVVVRSTVGAGDSMLAGVVLGLSRGMEIEDAVGLGIASGAAALLAPGTALAKRSDVERLHGTLVAA